MIQNTRLATSEEKDLIIQHLKGYSNPHPSTWPDMDYEENVSFSYNDWQSASFIIIEVKDLEGKIVVVNQVSKNVEAVLDIMTAHYLLHHDNTISDISNPDISEII